MLRLQAACTGEDEDHVVFNYPESEKNNLQPTSLPCNGNKYSLAYSNVGTLLAIADESGRVVHIEETDSFGRRLSRHKLANVAMLSFGDGQLDEDIGLVHFLFHDYDPATGFFIQRDPLSLRGGDVDVYGYGYCLDHPVNMVDLLGLRGKLNESVGDIFDRISDTPAGKIVLRSLASAGTGAIMGSTGGPAGIIIGAGSGFARGTMISATREIPQVRDFENQLKSQGQALWESIMAAEKSN